ncbi:MAG: transcriptional regulator [Candidatus Bathyarchaeia archaeon]|jgi:predicted transcriptional regulator
MILPCEIGVKTVLPAVKAIMARSIVQKHGYSEKQTANLLGISQSAVSRYVGRERGHNLLIIENTSEVLALIDEMVTSLIKQPADKAKVLELFCKTCAVIREKGLMCPKCQKEMTAEWAEKCFFCR